MADKLIWANLLHLSYNMWWDAPVPPDGNPSPYWQEIRRQKSMTPALRCDRQLWHDLTVRMAKGGLNMLVIDLGDAIRYASHPEIAVEGAWTPDELRRELARLRGLGLEPIPKLNFSTCHDAWLKEYERCVSTRRYYEVCADLIAETNQLFDQPRFFHLGYDEETYQHQRLNEYAVIRQGELWWHDFLFFVREVERAGVRPWIWSDYIWQHRDEFLRRMPKSVLQSNWYYGNAFDDSVAYLKAYHDLAAHGYDQVPTGSNWSHASNFGDTVKYCRQHLPAEHLLGFMQAPWVITLEYFRAQHEAAIDQVAAARQALA
jgi:hypothetical protein